VRRDPDGSPDGTPYLALNCGGPACARDAGAYQDVPIDEPRDDTPLVFGADLRAEAEPARVDVALIQLDASGREIARDTVTAGTTALWAAVRGRATLDDAARRLRLQLYLRSPATVRADNIVATAR
jgi:hypothetical protein